MAHYATLDEYHFSADVDDIRGANLYAADNQKIGKVADVIFDHDSGDIRYLVAELERGRKVLVPSSHVYRSLADEDDFETDISAAEMERMPAFQESMLRDEQQWREHERVHHQAWKQQEERLLAEYKQKWQESPVQHLQGSDRNITPDEEAGASLAERERIVTGADLFPRRIAGKFPGADPMLAPGNPDPGETTLHPEVDRSASVTQFGTAPPSERWRGFEENLRQNLGEIRRGCTTCCRPGQSRVA